MYFGKSLFCLGGMFMNTYQEIQEAIEAGQRALQSLNQAKKALNSARGWGFIDLLGDNMISGVLKHERIHSAKKCVEQAKRDFSIFQRELADVQSVPGLDINIDDFLIFADFFFDGFIADIFVQSRINQARKRIDEAIVQTENILRRLKQY